MTPKYNTKQTKVIKEQNKKFDLVTTIELKGYKSPYSASKCEQELGELKMQSWLEHKPTNTSYPKFINFDMYAVGQILVYDRAIIEEILCILSDHDVEYNEEIEVPCEECNGAGTFEEMNCKNWSNECCGGCYVEKPCECCDGTGIKYYE